METYSDIRSHAEPSMSAQAHSYNFEHFEPETLKEDAKLLRHPEGPHPGDPAPDFSLEDTEGVRWRLQEQRGRPVILVIGSGTCPITQGSLPGLKTLYREFGERCHWLMLYVREAHPGEKLQAHQSYDQKRDQARYFRDATGTPWPILVDELDGQVHRQYGLLPNSIFLIDVDGNVSFVGEISHAPTLRRALNQLFAQDQRGAVPEAEDKMPHMLGATAYGWEAIERGGNISKRDLTSRMPPLAANLWLGNKMRWMLDPIARRSTALSPTAKVGLGVATVASVWAIWRLSRKKTGFH